ncbi:LysR family transcriptional regulator [Zhihengliuella halotolerans]|uniref:DNA-binding transcriptional LysR family regulator n=1 Tax=Zhihengliuella halotolerans TaxID=370736 RepID=A0A4Q8AFC7_9MICC|nr:LysR family transcriptional regulator [Zhihengliuella halotolerans]RZU63022.1 DNA-binding transcriptional LysR family regulator [Zhihengliuella halotolerans]
MIKISSSERILLLSDVARFGTMTLAAEALGYSVSAISQQVRKLEAEAGQPLLQRHSRGIFLTDAGKSVVEHAEQIRGRLKSLQYSLDDIAGLRAGTLAMGTFPTAGASLVPLAINRFRREHPGVDLTVRSVRIDALLKMLTTREISLSLLWDYHWSRLDTPELELIHLLDDPTDLVVAPSHPLASRESVYMSELLDELWVVRAGQHPMIEVLVRAGNHVGFQPNIAYEANDYQEAQAIVAVGMGVALVPRLALTVLRDDVRVIPLAGEAPQRRILLARMADTPPTAAEASMTAMLKEASRRLVAQRVSQTPEAG